MILPLPFPLTLVQSRPFGVALLLGGIDRQGDKATPVLIATDPSGTFVPYLAKAVGSGSEGAQTSLQEQYDQVINTICFE